MGKTRELPDRSRGRARARSADGAKDDDEHEHDDGERCVDYLIVLVVVVLDPSVCRWPRNRQRGR